VKRHSLRRPGRLPIVTGVNTRHRQVNLVVGSSAPGSDSQWRTAPAWRAEHRVGGLSVFTACPAAWLWAPQDLAGLTHSQAAQNYVCIARGATLSWYRDLRHDLPATVESRSGFEESDNGVVGKNDEQGKVPPQPESFSVASRQ
jgi:hypothetical protein